MKTKTFLIVYLLLPLIAFSQNVSIGDILCTDGSIVSPDEYLSSGRTAKGIVFYVDESNQHGWAVHLEYQGGVHWSFTYEDIPTLPNYQKFREAINDFDGYENTRKIRQAGNASTYPAAWAVDFDHGWYLPAAGQIRYLYGYMHKFSRQVR